MVAGHDAHCQIMVFFNLQGFLHDMGALFGSTGNVLLLLLLFAFICIYLNSFVWLCSTFGLPKKLTPTMALSCMLVQQYPSRVSSNLTFDNLFWLKS